MKPGQYNILLRITTFMIISSFTSFTWAGQGISTKIRLAPADDIIGMDIRISDGKEVGEIEYLLIDSASAETCRSFRGADLRTPTAKDFGEIGQLVLDLDNAIVAHALIGHGGFLGMGEEWVSILLERLTWIEEK